MDSLLVSWYAWSQPVPEAWLTDQYILVDAKLRLIIYMDAEFGITGAFRRGTGYRLQMHRVCFQNRQRAS